MPDIACLLASDTPKEGVFPDYPHGASLGIPVYALRETDLSRFAALVIGNAVDQRELLRCKPQLQRYLNAGGKIVFSGHVEYLFLDCLQPYQPTPEKGLFGLQVFNANSHPIMVGVDGQDLTFRKGVAGFYGRGHNPPPAGAQLLTELGQTARLPLDWLYALPTGGQLLVHAGNDFLSFGNAPSAAGLRPAFFRWVADLPAQCDADLIPQFVPKTQQNSACSLSAAQPSAAAAHAAAPAVAKTAETEETAKAEEVADRAAQAEQADKADKAKAAAQAEALAAAARARVLFVENGTYFHHRTLHTPEFLPHVQHTRHVLDLRAQDFDDFDTLVFCCNTRADLIAPHRAAIADFLARGRTVVAMGNTQPERWLNGIEWQDSPVNFWWWTEPNADSGLRQVDATHRLFQHITLADATWHQHGYFKVPEGARSLVDKAGLGSVLYEDTVSTAGRLIITSLDPCYHHGSNFMPATTRFLRGFLPWLSIESARSQAAGQAESSSVLERAV